MKDVLLRLDLTEVYAEYAASIGKDALTSMEKQQALLASVLTEDNAPILDEVMDDKDAN